MSTAVDRAFGAFHSDRSVGALWDCDKLYMPRLYMQDVQNFLNETQKWASDSEVDQQMQEFALSGNVNASWRFLQSGIRQQTRFFQAPATSHRKYSASDVTKFWQDQNEQALRHGRGLYLTVSLQKDLALNDVLRGWHYVAHRQRADKQLGMDPIVAAMRRLYAFKMSLMIPPLLNLKDVRLESLWEMILEYFQQHGGEQVELYEDSALRGLNSWHD